MTRASTVHPGAALAALLVLLLPPALLPAPAHGVTEEFSTFDVESQEEDDESLLDHLLTRAPREWREEWRRAPQAIRSSQGCLTSGYWFIDTDLKVVTTMGRRARFGLDLRQSESDVNSYQNVDFTFRFPTRAGTVGALFRPLADKARQDFALMWEAGTDSTAWDVRAVFTFEDLFNNFWAFRQSRVGQNSEPYTRHPWEPALRAAVRQPRWRAEVEGRYLTPSRQLLANMAPASDRVRTLWGTWVAASLEVELAGITWGAAGSNRQAASTDQAVGSADGDARDFRRQWNAEASARRTFLPRLSAELRYLYAARSQGYRPPRAATGFDAVDRTLQAEVRWALAPRATARLGGLYDRITVWKRGDTGRFSYGTRNESRAYVGLVARFGRVSVAGVEGIELDPESYPVALRYHDKGFVQLQATF